MKNHLASLALAALTFMTTPVSAGEKYVAFMVGTKHFGTSDLNDITPGLTFGKRWDGSRAGTEWFAEGGAFYNSYEEISPIALIGTSMSLGMIGKTEIRAGAAIGTAYYKELSGRLEDRYGIPNAGGFIPMAVVSLAFRHEGSETRFTIVPPDDDATLIVNLSLTQSF